ncbi:MAG: porin [Gammaproteobacteria bacterium]|nr:porin [Gammaproteobacteria bacterium]
MSVKAKKSVDPLIIGAVAVLMLPAAVGAVEFEFSGHVNRLIMSVDNGEEDGLVHADNSVSGTRIRITGAGDYRDDMSVGLLYETELQSNPSSDITADSLDSDGINGDVGSGDEFSNRHSNVWIKGNFGKFAIGQNSGAANGSAEIDLSGTTVIQYVGSSNDLLGSLEYGTSGITVGDARSSFDGLSRNDNLRYDGAIDRVSFAGSIGNGDKVEAAIGYKSDSFEIRAAVWDEADSGDGAQGHAASASWLAGGGFNLTGSYGSEDSDGDPENLYFKLGYRTGDHAWGIDWSETRDRAAGDAGAVSVAWVGNLLEGFQMYACYRVESLDDVAGEDDITALVGGARLKF